MRRTLAHINHQLLQPSRPSTGLKYLVIIVSEEFTHRDRTKEYGSRHTVASCESAYDAQFIADMYRRQIAERAEAIGGDGYDPNFERVGRVYKDFGRKTVQVVKVATARTEELMPEKEGA